MTDIEAGLLIETTLKELWSKKPDPKAFKGLGRERAEELQALFKSYLQAIKLDDLQQARALEPRVFEAPEEDLKAFAPSVARACARCEVGMVRHLGDKGWFRRAKVEGAAPYTAGSPERELCAQMASKENRSGAKALVDMQLLSVDEALFFCARAESQALSVHFANILLARNERPSPQTADALCAHGARMGNGPEETEHPLERAWSAWADLISQKARAKAWACAVDSNQWGLIPALLKSGLSLEGWRLGEESYVENYNQTGRERSPKLLDYAMFKKSELDKGRLSETLKALLMIPGVAQGRGQVSPHALARGSAADLSAYQKAGVNIASVDELGQTVLHLQLDSKGYGARLNRERIVSAAKRVAPLFLVANKAGQTPLDLLKPEERLAAQTAMAQHEQAELRRELKAPKSGSKNKAALKPKTL